VVRPDLQTRLSQNIRFRANLEIAYTIVVDKSYAVRRFMKNRLIILHLHPLYI
jgi:hypothetical protein